MKLASCFLFFLLANGLFAQKNHEIAISKSIAIVDSFKAEKFNNVYLQGDSTFLRRVSTERLQNVWESLAYINGELLEVGNTLYDFLDTLHVTNTRLKYKNASIGLRIIYNLSWQISGLFIVDAEPMYNIPSYVNIFGFYEIKIPFGSKSLQNEAFLTVPMQEKKYPVVIIVGGSGPVDKNATLGANMIYKDFAWGLANKGIAVVRYDKVTKKHMPEIMKAHQQGDFYTIEKEYLNDLKSLIKKVSKKVAVDKSRIYLLGHSQGGGLMPLFLKENKLVAGAIMAAANYSSLPDLMIYQTQYLMPLQAKSKADSNLFFDAIRKANNAKKYPLPANFSDDSLPQNYPFSYWNYLHQINLVKLAQKNKKPVLLIQGERDYQVPQSEFLMWKEALKLKNNYQFISFEKLNHLFLEGTGKSTPDEYFKRSNIPDYVLTEIANWMNAQPRKR